MRDKTGELMQTIGWRVRAKTGGLWEQVSGKFSTLEAATQYAELYRKSNPEIEVVVESINKRDAIERKQKFYA
jgi:hypothetical protein